MNRYMGGVIAGLGAAGVISILILLKSLLGVERQLELIGMPSRMLGFGLPAAWTMHFLIGAVWGGLFALVFARLPGKSYAARGVEFGALAWLVMMLVVMPLAGAGLFGLNLGIGSPITTLALHLVFGATLGSWFRRLTAPHSRRRGPRATAARRATSKRSTPRKRGTAAPA
jgi:hypothetical protein